VLKWVTGHCNRAAVSRNRYGVKKTVDTHKILINAICKFTSWSGETPTGNFSDVFFILDKNNERPDWMSDLKHTDSAW
jgi:hypothetical protein